MTSNLTVTTSSQNFISMDQEAIELEKMENAYSLEEVIKKVCILSKGNLKTCLFIGRRGDESLPSNEQEIWMSLDLGFANKPYPLDKRIHIWCDLKDQQMSRFNHLFDKIVIDQSTTKFFNWDFISTCADLLKPTSESTLIFETSPQTYAFVNIDQQENRYGGALFPVQYLVEDTKKDKEYWEKHLKGLSEEEIRNFNSFPLSKRNNARHTIIRELRSANDDLRLVDKAVTWAVQDTKRHTEALFQNVQLIENTSYPYLTRYCSNDDSFFIATGIK